MLTTRVGIGVTASRHAGPGLKARDDAKKTSAIFANETGDIY